ALSWNDDSCKVKRALASEAGLAASDRDSEEAAAVSPRLSVRGSLASGLASGLASALVSDRVAGFSPLPSECLASERSAFESGLGSGFASDFSGFDPDFDSDFDSPFASGLNSDFDSGFDSDFGSDLASDLPSDLASSRVSVATSWFFGFFSPGAASPRLSARSARARSDSEWVTGSSVLSTRTGLGSAFAMATAATAGSGFLSGLAAARRFSRSLIAFSTSVAASPPRRAPWNDSRSERSRRSRAASGSVSAWVSARSRWPRASTRRPTSTP